MLEIIKKSVGKLKNFLILLLLGAIGFLVILYAIQRRHAENLSTDLLIEQSKNDSLVQLNDTLYRKTVHIAKDLETFRDSLSVMKGEITQWQSLSLKYKKLYYSIPATDSFRGDTTFVYFREKNSGVTVSGYTKTPPPEAHIEIEHDPITVKMGVTQVKNKLKTAWVKSSNPAVEITDVDIIMLNAKKRSIHGWGIGIMKPWGVIADINLWNLEFGGGFNVENKSLFYIKKNFLF